MNWVQHRFEGNAPSARHKHTCSTLGVQIFIFGGMEAPPVGFSDLYILDTQPEEKTIGMKREGKVEMSGKERKG
jgi:hypothetical protein